MIMFACLFPVQLSFFLLWNHFLQLTKNTTMKNKTKTEHRKKWLSAAAQTQLLIRLEADKWNISKASHSYNWIIKDIPAAHRVVAHTARINAYPCYIFLFCLKIFTKMILSGTHIFSFCYVVTQTKNQRKHKSTKSELKYCDKWNGINTNEKKWWKKYAKSNLN